MSGSRNDAAAREGRWVIRVKQGNTFLGAGGISSLSVILSALLASGLPLGLYTCTELSADTRTRPARPRSSHAHEDIQVYEPQARTTPKQFQPQRGASSGHRSDMIFRGFSSRATTHSNTRNVVDGSQWPVVYDYADGLSRTYDTSLINVTCCDDVSCEQLAQCASDISRGAVESSSSP